MEFQKSKIWMIITWKYWISTGIAWGLLMLIINGNMIYPIVTGERSILKKILNSNPIWLIGGLVFRINYEIIHEWATRQNHKALKTMTKEFVLEFIRIC